MTDSNGTNMYMPVAPAFGYGGGNGGFGNMFGGDGGWWLILLFLLCGNGMWGGFGGMGGMMWPMMMGGMGAGYGLDYLYPWLNNSQHISDGFRDQNLQTSIGALQNSVTSGFGDVQLGIAGVNQNVCQSGNSIVSAVTGAQNAIAQQLYSNEIANLNRSFAEQTANTAGMTALQSQLASCCCDNRAAISDLKFVVSTEACADRAAIASALRDVIDATQNQTQTILDKMCQQEIDALKTQNLALQNQVNMQALAASQAAQTAALVADNTMQTQYIVNRVAPYPVPSYTVANPNTPAA